ncbi:putative kinase [Hyphodiscus hymeniophilus]|uniref:Kinase n=1 Tax=Hyphodiscus hymeniophilus TaxID=353542 RepID=A0A9P6VIY3_9HELO|nr:putative kinase [Hyphodiscus hymeniophilus]
MTQSSPPKIDLPARVQFDGPGPFSPGEEAKSSVSDDEYQHALEVVFDAQNAHRRKSSLVPAENPSQYFERRKNTECYVHALLEQQRAHGGAPNGGLENIAESLASSRLAEDHADQPDSVVEAKGSIDRRQSHTPGQEDQTSWQERLMRQQSHELGDRDEDTKKMEAYSTELSPVHSRLLTKKQLSEMAWGVRELSKRLGSIRLKLKVRNVFILTKAHDEELIGNTGEMVKWLLSSERDVKYNVYVEDNLKNNKKFDAPGLLDEVRKEYSQGSDSNGENRKLERRLKYWDNEMCRTRPHTFDFIISLGGDGTVLYASWLFQRIVPPVLSFALGSLGFLTKFDFDIYQETLTKAFRDGVTISLRLRFEGTVMRSQERKRAEENGHSDGVQPQDGNEQRDLVEELIGQEKGDERTHRPDGTYEILNDIVVDRGPNPTMSATEIFGDDEHFTSVQADGVCVATPTGSTAYNLAAGGSLCHPENPVILVTAICAHTLSFRPIILPDTIVLRIGVPYDARTSSWASFDGRERVELEPGDYVTISASRYPFANVMSEGRRSEDWVNSLRGKLGWNSRQRQKSYKEWS